jgi:hypothetical protein
VALPPAMICVAVNGGIQGKETHPALSRGRKFADNAESVKRVVRLAGELNPPIAKPAQARRLLGLPERSGSRFSA